MQLLNNRINFFLICCVSVKSISDCFKTSGLSIVKISLLSDVRHEMCWLKELIKIWYYRRNIINRFIGYRWKSIQITENWWKKCDYENLSEGIRKNFE